MYGRGDTFSTPAFSVAPDYPYMMNKDEYCIFEGAATDGDWIARMFDGSCMVPGFGAATANERTPKFITVELMTRSPRVGGWQSLSAANR